MTRLVPVPGPKSYPSPMNRRLVVFACSFIIGLVGFALGAGSAPSAMDEWLAPLGAITAGSLFVAILATLEPGADGRPSRADETEAGWEAFRLELNRARRFERPLALIRIPLRQDAAVSSNPVGKLRGFLRGIDRTWQAEGDVYVALPETTRRMAEALVARMAASVPELVERQEVGLASFPDDGLTAGALVAAAHRVRLVELPAPIPAGGASDVLE